MHALRYAVASQTLLVRPSDASFRRSAARQASPTLLGMPCGCRRAAQLALRCATSSALRSGLPNAGESRADVGVWRGADRRAFPMLLGMPCMRRRRNTQRGRGWPGLGAALLAVGTAT